MSFSCKEATSQKKIEEQEKLDVYYQRFDIYIKSSELNKMPCTYSKQLNEKDSVLISFQENMGKSTYKLFYNGELVEKGIYESSLGVLAKYLTQYDEYGEVIERTLYRYYQPFPEKVQIIKDINGSNFYGTEE